jgi:hypothetical protein
VRNIFIRYEDRVSAVGQGDGKFVMGLLLKELSLHTVGEDWQTEVMTLSEEITRKLAKVEEFSIFLDYESSE